MRRGLIVANWKLHGNKQLIGNFAKNLVNIDNTSVDVGFTPPVVYLAELKKLYPCLAIGAQSGSAYEAGAFTGEISMQMLADIGCQYVLIGHSERRTIFLESDEITLRQTQKAIEAGLTPILCIGETDLENQSGQTFAVLSRQIETVTSQLSTDDLKKLVVAYEPVWAIGTGRTPSFNEINKIHQKIRSIFGSINDTIAASIKILYGGSVKPENAKDIFLCEHVDGGLVGGASLDIESFKLIIQAYK